MKNLGIVFLTLIASFHACQKQSKPDKIHTKLNDSLTYYLDVAYNDALDRHIRFNCNKRALAIVEKMANDSMTRVYYFRIANRFWNMNAIHDYNSVIKKTLKKATIADDNLALAKAYNYMSSSFDNSGLQDSAYYYFDKSEKIYIKLKDTVNVAYAILTKAHTQYYAYDFIGSQKNIYKAIKLLGNRNSEEDKKILLSAYNLLGCLNSDIADYRKSIVYYEKCKSISKTMTDTLKYHYRANFDNNIGCAYQNAGDHAKALPYFKRILQDTLLKFEAPKTYTQITSNYAAAKLNTGDFTELPEMILKARRLADSIDAWPTYSNATLTLAEYYKLKGKPILALKYAKEAFKVARTNKAIREVLLSLTELSKYDKENAENYFTTFVNIRDSLQLLERINPDKFAKIEYQVEQFKVQQEHIKADRDLANRNLEIAIVMFIIIGMIVAILYLIISRRNKANSLALIEEQQRTNEEMFMLMSDQQHKIEEGKKSEKQRISHELHDGVMGRLSSIRLNLALLTKRHDDATIPKFIEYIDDIQEVEKEIRIIAYDLEKDLFSGTVDFETIIKNLYNDIDSHSVTEFSFITDNNIDWSLIDNNTKLQVYRIMQEALNNIGKYAMASNVKIVITKRNDEVAISIDDDGIGFDINTIKRGIGFKSMAFRAKAIKGKLKIISKPQLGTSINLIFNVSDSLVAINT